MRVVKELIEPIVEEAVKKKRLRIDADGEKKKKEGGGCGGGEDEGTLLENLVNETDDLKILRDEIMSLLVAGRDSVSRSFEQGRERV
jgi:hypothetical protein